MSSSVLWVIDGSGKPSEDLRAAGEMAALLTFGKFDVYLVGVSPAEGNLWKSLSELESVKYLGVVPSLEKLERKFTGLVNTAWDDIRVVAGSSPLQPLLSVLAKFSGVITIFSQDSELAVQGAAVFPLIKQFGCAETPAKSISEVPQVPKPTSTKKEYKSLERALNSGSFPPTGIYDLDSD